jgi:hydrogenase maturation protein HypF
MARPLQSPILIDQFPIIQALVDDVRRGVPVERIAARFHNGVVNVFEEALIAASALTGINRVALSGGVFQNGYLSDRLEQELPMMGFEVFSHGEVPPNDACISVGQAWIGARKLRERREKSAPAKEEHPA